MGPTYHKGVPCPWWSLKNPTEILQVFQLETLPNHTVAKPVLDFITTFDIVKGSVHFLRAHLRVFSLVPSKWFGILTEIISCMYVRLKGGKTQPPQ